MEEVGLDMEEWKLEQCNLDKAFENCLSRCKKIEEHFSSTWNSFQAQLKAREEAIELREKQLEEKESYFESLRECKEEELDAVEEVITEKLIQVEQVKSELESVGLLVEEKRQELDSKEQRFLEVEELVREKERECELIQNRVEERTVNLRRIEKVIVEMEMKVSSEESMKDWCHKLDLKKKELEKLSEKLELKKELLNQTIGKLRGLDNRVKYCLNEVQRKERELELKETQGESQVEELKLTVMRAKKGVNEVELNQCLDSLKKSEKEEEKRLLSLIKIAEERKKHLDLHQKLVKESQKELDSLSDELEMEMWELYRQAKDIELKQTQFDCQLNTEQSEHSPGASNEAIPLSVTSIISSRPKKETLNSSLTTNSTTFLSSNIHATSDQRNIPGLEDNMSGNGCIHNELAASLRLAPDPAKLVLNYMQKFVSQYLRNENFEERIMLWGAISILKELMIISPHVGSHLKEDSTTLAAQWKEKMRGSTVNPDESLAFSLFTAMYGLVSMLNVDEIVTLLGLISQNEKALELCHAHKFAVKIADLILILIEKKHMIEAVRFICTFKLIDKLPPIPLLKEYVEDAKKCFEAVCSIRIASVGKVKAVDNLIGFLRAVHQCIKDYNLDESEFPSADIELLVARLERQKVNWRLLVPSVGSNEHNEQRKRKEPGDLTYYRRVSTRRVI